MKKIVLIVLRLMDGFQSSRVRFMQFSAKFIALVAAGLFVSPQIAPAQSDDSSSYKPTWESLEQHEVPEWYQDAKFGIWIHWGIYSVSAWAPRGEYAEWYAQRLQPEKARGEVARATRAYHRMTYGEDFQYEDFIPMWKAENWDPKRWANLFKKVGAKYVVLTGEHHDGFPLWNSQITEWNAANMGPKRDIVGELAEAVKTQGLKFAPSYHALLNYYTPKYSGPNPDYLNDDYVTFMNAKLRELIDKYHPDLLWLDGDWMGSVETFRTKETLAYYYNQAEKWGKKVAANDRLGRVRGVRGDFYTQEYDYDKINQLIAHKWENTRGMASSFGYNRNEPEEDYLSVDELVDLFVDNVSKNANLLLDVGPKADGTIPEVQRKLLIGFGNWLNQNSEAIYGTRPWVEAEGMTTNSARVRFTQKKGAVYAILLDVPQSRQVTIKALYLGEDATVEMLGNDHALRWVQDGTGVAITLSDELPDSPAYVLKITPQPWRLMKKTAKK